MSYEVLARKLRPAGFDALVGQEHVVRALRHALDHDRLHHAYLFTGTRGVGKTTIARILAKALNCEQGVSSTPCESCSICTEVKENRFIDLIEVDAASRTGVDDTRELLENAQYLPTRGRYKVYLVDEVHMLSNASFNALLKTLEEPPEHVKFLLATTDPKKVPVTVLSRCLQFQLKNLSREQISDYLAQVLETEGVSFDQQAVEIVARCASGSMRDALSLTDQAISYGQGALRHDDVVQMLGVVGADEIRTIAQSLYEGNAELLLDCASELASNNADFVDVLENLTEYFHQEAISVALGNESLFSADALQLYYQITLHGYRDIHIAPDAKSGFEMTLLRLLAFAPVSAPVGEGMSGTETGGAETQGRETPGKETQGKETQGIETTAAQMAIGRPDAVATRPAGQQPKADQPQIEKGDKTLNAGGAITESPDSAANQAAAELEAQDAPGDPSSTKLETERSRQWIAIVDSLAIGGVTKMIAEHANLVHYDLPSIGLCLEQGHDTLLNDQQIAGLQRALEEALACEVELEVSVGETPEETPAQYRARMIAERQRAAETDIGSDEKVIHLLSEFDGRLEEIRPV
ncbi:MAG: DNA polymerase III subunit gamma/tau [Pseudomonadota bacterium]